MELDLRADGAHRYAVTLTAPGDDTLSVTHVVSVPPSLLEELQLTLADEPVLVRQAVELLASGERPPLPERFSLTDAEQLRPGLTEELRTLVGR